jgi:hypothetical protein
MRTGYWPGTGIKKSTGNAFTERPAVVMATPSEQARAKAQESGIKGRAAHPIKAVGNLSQKAQRQLSYAPTSISIEKAGSSKSDRIRRGGI